MKTRNRFILPKDIIKPDYESGSIVNLMSSIMKASGGKSDYSELKILKGNELHNYKNILLVIIDGLGYEYLEKYGRDSFLGKNLRGKITSVFPATTNTAITTFATGTAPQQHAMTGWFMNAKELGAVIIPLRFTPRIEATFSQELNPELLFDQTFITKKIKRKSYLIQHKDIVNSTFNAIAFKGYAMTEYCDLVEFFSKIKDVSKKDGKKFIHAYWPMIDALIHEYGTKDIKVLKHFRELDGAFERLSKSLKDTVMIIVADHGLTDTGTKNTILLKNHPRLEKMLSQPISGDSRASYVYVHPDMTKEFESYIKKNFKDKCTMLTRKQAIASGLFGRGKSHPKLEQRIGDYVLIWRKNYAFKDALLGQNEKIKKGSHGGASSTEMYVPLIIIKR